MITEINSSAKNTFLWGINPFEVISSIWKDVVEGSKLAVPHAVGTMRQSHGTVVELEMDVVLHAAERKVVLKEGDETHFLFPVNPAEGPEGLYIRLIEALGMGA